MGNGRMIRRFGAAAGALALVGAATLPASAAGNGSPDPGFGTAGRVSLPPIFSFGGSNRVGNVAIDGSGRAVVTVARRGLAAILRYTPSGNLDSSFGDFGVLRVPTANGCTSRVALLADGRIRWAVGNPAGNATRVYAYDANAKQADPAYGATGWREAPVPCPAATATRGGVLYVAGERRVVALGTDGRYDRRFAGDGSLDLAADLTDLAVAANGDLLVGFGPVIGRLGRYGPAGRPSTSFAGGSPLRVAPAPQIALTPGTGRIVVAGKQPSSVGGCAGTASLRRYLADGSVDVSWAEPSLSGTCAGAPNDLLVTSTREVVLASGANGPLRRFAADGPLTATFGLDARHARIAGAADGSVFGVAETGGGTEPTVVTASGYGSPAPTYTRRIDVAWPADAVPRLLTLRSGRLTMVMDGRFPDGAGGAPEITRPDFLGRLRSDGSLDTGFDGDGIADPFRGGGRANVSELRATATGYIAAVHKDTFYGVAKLRSDGSLIEPLTMTDHIEDSVLTAALDSQGRALFYFDYGGIHRANADGTNDPAYNDAIVPELQALSGPTMVVRPDDRALVWDAAGAIVDLQIDGLTDPTFDGDGVVQVGQGRADFAGLGAVAVDDSGRIVVAYTTTGLQGKVVRLLANGSPDTAFAATTLPFAPTRITLDPAGRLVVAGGPVFGTGAARVARIQTNGGLDSGFGTGGSASISGDVRPSDLQVIAGTNAIYVTSPNRVVRLVG